MKKFLLLLFLLCITSSVKALYFNYSIERIDDYYITRTTENRKMSGKLYFISNLENNDFFYCIEPFNLFNKNYEYEVFDYNDEILNISDEDYKKINLIAYYGYGYKGHAEIKWYVATQYLIWQTLYPDVDIYFSSDIFGQRIDILNDEINEINDLVSNDIKGFYYKDYYEVTTNHEYTILENELINNYEIITDIPYEIKNNCFIIKPNKKGLYKVTLKRKNNITTYLYYSSQSQNIIKPGTYDETFEFDIKVITKDLEVIKKDLEDDKFISDALYGLYDLNDNLIKSSKTDKNGKIVFKDLAIDKYYLKEIEPSYGYKLDSNIYEIDLSIEDSKIVYDEKILKEIKIKKYYKYDDELKDELDAKFIVYQNDIKVGEYQTDDNGIIILNLPYGKYHIEQISGLKGFKLAEPLDIIVDDKSDNYYETINEPEENIKITSIKVPDTYKNGIYFYLKEFINCLINYYKKY